MQENCCAEHLVEKDEKMFSHTRHFDLIGRLILFRLYVNFALEHVIGNASTLLRCPIYLGVRVDS